MAGPMQESRRHHVENVASRATVERQSLDENLAIVELLLGRRSIRSTDDQGGAGAEALLQLEIESRSKHDEQRTFWTCLAEEERWQLHRERGRREVRDRARALGLEIVPQRGGGYLVFPANEADVALGLTAAGYYAYHWETVIELVERHAARGCDRAPQPAQPGNA